MKSTHFLALSLILIMALSAKAAIVTVDYGFTYPYDDLIPLEITPENPTDSDALSFIVKGGKTYGGYSITGDVIQQGQSLIFDIDISSGEIHLCVMTDWTCTAELEPLALGDYDLTVNIRDYNYLGELTNLQTYTQNFTVSAGNGILNTQIPEPMTISLLGLGGLAILRRR